MRRDRGFTLIEAAVVMAIVAILAGAAVYTVRSSMRNASVGAAAFDLVGRLGNLRTKAMTEGVDYLLVFADAPNSDATQCTTLSSDTRCARYWVFRSPTTSWSLGSFDPSSPLTNATLVDSYVLPTRIHLDAANTSTRGPAPFNGLLLHDADMTATRGSSQKCFALRFGANGKVSGESGNGNSTTLKRGFSFGLASDLNTEGGADRRAVLVSFPTGIVKSFSY